MYFNNFLYVKNIKMTFLIKSVVSSKDYSTYLDYLFCLWIFFLLWNLLMNQMCEYTWVMNLWFINLKQQTRKCSRPLTIDLISYFVLLSFSIFSLRKFPFLFYWNFLNHSLPLLLVYYYLGLKIWVIIYGSHLVWSAVVGVTRPV